MSRIFGRRRAGSPKPSREAKIRLDWDEEGVDAIKVIDPRARKNSLIKHKFMEDDRPDYDMFAAKYNAATTGSFSGGTFSVSTSFP